MGHLTFRRTILGLILVSGCGRPATPPLTVTEWTVTSLPARTISDSGLPTGVELSRISDARLLPNGGLVVANAGSFELLLFNPSGSLIKRVGRRGQGPGDFAGLLHLFAGSADSLVVADAGNLRWSVWNEGLSQSRTALMAEASFPRPAWLYRGATVIEATLGETPNWVRQVVDTLRARDPDYTRLIEARRDDLGVLWIRDQYDANRWTAHAGTGRPAGAVRFPAGFRITQIGPEVVVGVTRDSLEVERVEMLALERTGSVFDEDRPLGSLRSSLDSLVQRQLIQMMGAQELFYSNHRSYTASPDSLALEVGPDLRVFGLAGDVRQWAAVAVDRKSGTTCGVWVGGVAPAGWLDGTPFCGR